LRVEQLRPRIQHIADGLLDQMACHPQVDLIDALAFPLPATVICELLGVPTTDHGAFRHAIRDLFNPATVRTAAATLAGYVTSLIHPTQPTPTDHLTTARPTARAG